MVDCGKTMFFHPRQFLHTLAPIALMLEVGQEVSQPRNKIQNLVSLVFCWSGGRNGYEPDALDASRDWRLIVPELAPTMKTDVSFHAGKVHEEGKSEK
jgi:hypothetical protein